MGLSSQNMLRNGGREEVDVESDGRGFVSPTPEGKITRAWLAEGAQL